MEIIKARSAGFCFGVKKAMEAVYKPDFGYDDEAVLAYMVSQLERG